MHPIVPSPTLFAPTIFRSLALLQHQPVAPVLLARSSAEQLPDAEPPHSIYNRNGNCFMIKNFSEYSLLEKVEFKEKFVHALKRRYAEWVDPIAKWLLKEYIDKNEDDFIDWVELADVFSTSRFVITSKNNKPQVIKASRFLRKILPTNLFSSDRIDQFVNDLLADSMNDVYFELWHMLRL